MYDLFQDVPNQSGGMVFPELRRIREGLRRSIARVQLYRLENPKSLTATHPLIRLLMSLNVPLSLEVDQYRDRVAEVTYALARNLQFTSAVSEGKLHSPSMFYGDNVSDVVLVHDEDFDLTGIAGRWKDLQAVRVLYHPQTDVCLHVPDGTAPSQEPGVAVVSINLPMLAVQYKLWRHWERGAVAGESPRTVMMFLQAHVLPQMLASHLDCAIFNRLFNRYYRLTVPTIRSRHPFYLTDWSREIDAVLSKYLDLVQTRKMDFDTMIETMPTAGYDSRYATVKWPDMPFTYQTTWALVLARLASVMFLVHVSHEGQNNRNRGTLNDLNRFFIKLRQMNGLRPLPSDELGVVNAAIDQGIIPYLTAS